MPRRPADPSRDEPTERLDDEVESLIEAWANERPDVPMGSLRISLPLRRALQHAELRRAKVLADHGVSAGTRPRPPHDVCARYGRLGPTLQQHDTNLPGLVGAERSEQPGFTVAGLWSGLSPEDCAKVAPEVTAEFNTPHVKMFLGSTDVGFERERVAAVRSAIEPDAALIVDAAQAYDWRTALKLAKAMDGFDVTWFEDPVEYEDWEELERFGAEGPMPMGTGEHVYGLDQLKQLLDQGQTKYIVLDLERIGGITDFLAAAALCEAYRVELVTHCYPHVSVQVLAASRAGTWCELAPLWDGYFGKPVVREGGFVQVSTAPGIGLDLVPGS